MTAASRPSGGTVVVWERDGLWEARLSRELEPRFRVRAARSAADARDRLGVGPSALVLVADTAGDWLDAGPRSATATLLIAEEAGDPWWNSAGVAATFDPAASAGRVADVVRRVLCVTTDT